MLMQPYLCFDLLVIRLSRPDLEGSINLFQKQDRFGSRGQRQGKKLNLRMGPLSWGRSGYEVQDIVLLQPSVKEAGQPGAVRCTAFWVKIDAVFRCILQFFEPDRSNAGQPFDVFCLSFFGSRRLFEVRLVYDDIDHGLLTLPEYCIYQARSK